MTDQHCLPSQAVGTAGSMQGSHTATAHGLCVMMTPLSSAAKCPCLLKRGSFLAGFLVCESPERYNVSSHIHCTSLLQSFTAVIHVYGLTA